MPFPLTCLSALCRLLPLALLAALASGAARASTVLVSNEKGNSITVLDGATLKLIKTVPVGQRPRGIVLSQDKRTLYICASDDDEIEQLDLDTYTMKEPLPSGADPETFALHPDGEHLYVSNEDNSLVSIVDIAERKIIGEIPVGIEPEGMGISPDGKWIVNTSETTNMAHFIDNTTHKVVANVLVDSRPRRAVWTADGKEVWVSSEIGGSVSVIDPTSHAITHKIKFAISGVPKEAVQAVGIAITGDRKLAFVALGPANRVAVVDGATYEVKKYLLVGQRVWNLAFTPDESRLYPPTASATTSRRSTFPICACCNRCRSAPSPGAWSCGHDRSRRQPAADGARIRAAPARRRGGARRRGSHHAFGAREVLRHVSFTLHPGAFTVLLGLNGAGKTTLCRSYPALRPPQRRHPHLRPETRNSRRRRSPASASSSSSRPSIST